MRGDRFHLVKYEWEGNLFDKQGISKSAIFGKGSDAVVSCSLSGRGAYLHPASGLAFIKDDFGKAVENVVEGVSWEGTQSVEGDAIDKFVSSLEDMEDFELVETAVRTEEEHTKPSSITEAISAREERSVLKAVVLERYGETQIEMYGSKLITTGINCPRILQLISNSLSD